MHPLRALAVYGLAVFVGGALLAPGLYWVCAFGAAHWPGLSGLGDVPFHRVINRSLLGVALAGLWPLLRTLRANSWAAVGLVKSGDVWRKAALGFALGFASLACAALLAMMAGARHLDSSRSLPWVLSAVGSALATAVVVACLEELLFRGAIFGSLRRAQPWPAALLLSSALYALVHFFERSPEPGHINWATGLVVLAQMCHGFVEVERLVPGFFTLTLAGLILGLAYQRTGTLYCSIGLHAGWIFWLKLYRGLTTEQAGANAWLWGTSNLIDGWVSLLILAPFVPLVWRVFPRCEPVEKDAKTVANGL